MEIVSIEANAFERIISKVKILNAKVENLSLQISPKKIDEWMDNQDVCLMLKINLRTLQTLRETGKLPFTKVGKKIFYKPQDILLFAEKRRIKI